MVSLYNDVKEHLNPTVLLDTDKEVEFHVDLLKNILRKSTHCLVEMSGNSSQIRETLVEGKRSRHYFELLPDGVHASHLLAQRWLRRLELDIVRECYLPTDILEIDDQVFLAFQ